jgi:hypothetical protein
VKSSSVFRPKLLNPTMSSFDRYMRKVHSSALGAGNNQGAE